YMSAVLENVPVELRERLALAVGVSVLHALFTLGAEHYKLRWPNDVVCQSHGGHEKIAGLLCEAGSQGTRWAVVIGIGMNLTEVDLPAELHATSLAQVEIDATPRAVAEAILSELSDLSSAALVDVVDSARVHLARQSGVVRLYDGAQVTEGQII